MDAYMIVNTVVWKRKQIWEQHIRKQNLP
jgi:hypothetical protein